MKADPEYRLFQPDQGTNQVKKNRKAQIACKFPKVIFYGEIFLTDQVGEDHHSSVTNEGCPGRAIITVNKMVGTQGNPPEIQN